MFAPNISTHQLADTIHHERLEHAALLSRVARDRKGGGLEVDRTAARRMTSRRLTATIAAAALTLVVAAAAAANQAAEAPAEMNSANGAGLILIR